jgi:hypothetical protein
MTRHGETGRDAASSVGTVIVTETSVGGDTQQIAAGLSPTSHGRSATTSGQHPTICYLPGSVRVRR